MTRVSKTRLNSRANFHGSIAAKRLVEIKIIDIYQPTDEIRASKSGTVRKLRLLYE